MSPSGKYAISPYRKGIRIFDTHPPSAEDLSRDPTKSLTNTHTSGYKNTTLLFFLNNYRVLTVSHHPFWPIMASGDFGGMVSEVPSSFC